jgi:plastocyanin
MSEQKPIASPHTVLTRRQLLAAGGTSALVLLSTHRVLAHGDEDDDNSGPGGDDDHDDDSGSDDEGDVTASGTVPAGSIEVQIIDDDADAFQPGTVTIELGQSVTWVNLDKHDHTATGAGFDTGIIQPGDLTTVTFDAAGSFAYSCQIHPEMVGRVDVRDASGNLPTAANASPVASPAVTSGPAVEVAIINIAFDPPQLDVSAGTTVTWTNLEAVPHTVTAADGGFDSGTLDEGGTFQHTFAEAGTFDYVCAIHPSMQASVIVSG